MTRYDYQDRLPYCNFFHADKSFACDWNHSCLLYCNLGTVCSLFLSENKDMNHLANSLANIYMGAFIERCYGFFSDFILFFLAFFGYPVIYHMGYFSLVDIVKKYYREDS